MRKLLIGLAVVHVAGLVSFFTIPFGLDQPRIVYSELFEVDFEVFPAVFALTGGLIALLIALHYRSLEEPGGLRLLRALSVAACAALIAMAAGAVALVPPASALFAVFGADLPAPTLALYEAYRWWWLLPLLGLAATTMLFVPGGSSLKVVRFSSASLAGLLILANLSLFASLTAMFLPFFKMCGPVEMSTGFTRLHAAAMLGKVASVRRHLERGVEANVETNTGYRPLDQVDAGKQPELAALLARHGAQRSTRESRNRKIEQVRVSQAPATSSCGV